MNNSSRFPIFFIFFIDNFGLGVVFPLITPFLLDPNFGFFGPNVPTGALYSYIGITLAAFPFAQFFGSPFFGDLADQLGRKRALYLTVCGTLVGFIISGIGVYFRSFGMLLAGRIFTGFCAGNASICLAALADLSKGDKERARNFGWIALLGGVSWIFAIIVGGIASQKDISKYFGPSLPFYITAALSFLSLLVLRVYFKETYVKRDTKKKLNIFAGLHHIGIAFKMRNLRLLYFTYFLWFLSWVMGMEWFAPSTMQVFGISQTDVSIGLCIMGATWSLGSSAINNLLLKKLEIYPITLLGLGLVSLFLCTVGIGINFPYVVTMYSITCIFAAFVWSNSMNLMSLQAGEDDQGTVMGVSMSMQALGWVLGPLLGSAVATMHLRAIYWVSAGISFIAFFVLLSVRSRFTKSA